MNYIREINEFYNWLRQGNCLSEHAIVLWHALMDIANRKRWPDAFTIPMSVLITQTSCSRRTIERARKELIDAGRISYEPSSGNLSGIYKLIPFSDKDTVIIEYTTDSDYFRQQLDMPSTSVEDDPVYRTVQNMRPIDVDVPVHQTDVPVRQTDVPVRQTDVPVRQTDHINKLYNKLNIKHNKDVVVIDENAVIKLYTDNFDKSKFNIDRLKQYCNLIGNEMTYKAVELAIINRSKSFKYIDAIIVNWFSNGIRSINDYNQHEAERKAKPKDTAVTKVNQFHNFPQRNYDFVSLEKSIQEANMRRYKEYKVKEGAL